MTPLFPLPDVVFFPKTLLPLHVYEPRYRALASEALEQDRIICTALLKPGWESDYYGSPEVYPVGCVGKIVQHQKLPDGRYNITLDGLAKVRIESSVQLTPYRLVRVSPMEDDSTWARGENAGEEAAELVRLFREVHEGQAPPVLLAEMFGQNMTPESVLNTVALHLNAEPDLTLLSDHDRPRPSLSDAGPDSPQRHEDPGADRACAPSLPTRQANQLKHGFWS